jgi:hypothetical protein
MVSDPLPLMLQRLDDEPPVFFAEEAHEHLGPALERLVGLGLLRETTPATSAPCWDCGRGYVGRVEFVTSSRTGRRHAYVPCPECGAVEVPLDRLKRWAVDVPGLLAAVADAAGVRGPPAEAVAGHLWRVGKANWGQRPREVYFAWHVYEDNRPALAAEMSRRPKALLFLPTEASVRRWGGATTNLAVALESVVTFGPAALAFDLAYVESRLTDAGLTGEVKAKRPPRKRAERAGKIEALVREMAEHLRAARDYAYATKERTGTPELLLRPSQQDLAKRTGLTKADVSRCLADESARELRLYWETALDLDQILRWKGRPRGQKTG